MPCEGPGVWEGWGQPHLQGAPGWVEAPGQVHTESNVSTGLWGTELVCDSWGRSQRRLPGGGAGLS